MRHPPAFAFCAAAAWLAAAPIAALAAGLAAAPVTARAAGLAAAPVTARAARPLVPPATAMAARAGEVLVLTREPWAWGAGGGPAAEGAAGTLGRLGIERVERVGPMRRAGALQCLRLKSARPGFDAAAAARELRGAAGVVAAAPNYSLRLLTTLPDDSYLGDQWYIQSGVDGDVQLPEAWDLEMGSAATRIGVMDTGVDTGHPDLAAKIWTNPGEIPANGLDDDVNGLIDDVRGWDFGVDDNDPNPGPFIDPELGLDIGFHGTFVAGIAAAATDNTEGIAGAGWNCSIVPLKVANDADDIPLSAVSAAFAYATDMGLEVLNMSLGAPDDPGVGAFFQALVDDATAAGVLCVAAAGNSGTSALNFPAACNGALSVAAIDEDNTRSSFSNWGSTVDLAAPGSSMWSSFCRNYTIDEFSLLFYEVFFLWDGDPNHPYMYGDGTSFAAPLAAGVCGLVRSRWPALPPADVIQHLVQTGEAIPFDHAIGPKLDAYAAISTNVIAVAADASGRGLAAWPNPTGGALQLAFALERAGRVRVAVFDAAGRRVATLADGWRAAGPQRLSWDGRSERGERVGNGIYFAEARGEGFTLRRRVALLR